MFPFSSIVLPLLALVAGLLLDEARGLDVPFGVFTPEEVQAFENAQFDSAFSDKTAPVDGLEGGAGNDADVLTIVLDFKAPNSPQTTDIFNNTVGSFDVTAFGFMATDFDMVAQSILDSVVDDYFTELVNTVAGPANQSLAIDFILGDIGTAPAGVTEFYFIQIGSGTDAGNPLGIACLGCVRDAAGNVPGSVQMGDVVGSVFTDMIVTIGGLQPANALTSGNLALTTFAIGGTTSHEAGHTLSLDHLNKTGSVTPNNLPPIMGTGAIDLPNQDRIGNREFSLSGTNAQANGTMQFHVQQLVNAVGLQATTGASSSESPSEFPSHSPTMAPSSAQSESPSVSPSSAPTKSPTPAPTPAPTSAPTFQPTASLLVSLTPNASAVLPIIGVVGAAVGVAALVIIVVAAS